MLFLGGGSTLYYPDGTNPTTIGACRAYFQLNGLTVGDQTSPVRAFNLNFGDESTGITEVEANSHLSPLASHLSHWYDLSGRRVVGAEANATPSSLNAKLKKGVYVSGGRKVVVK